MQCNDELTVVIPAKNEESWIGTLLDSLLQQDYALLPTTRVVLADAHSTDRTVEVALARADRLPLCVVPGGLPSVGRNAGARLAQSTFVLFVDADMELADRTLLRRALEYIRERDLDCVTTNIAGKQGTALDRFFYAVNNAAQRLSRLGKPYSSGMFLLFRKAAFDRLGGFDARVAFAEDYFLTRRLNPKRFGIVPGSVLTTNRRFHRIGYLRMATLFLNTALHSNDDAYFFRDHGYWR
ncbi:MAG: glycosyltransferase [Acidobacteria bacterium]|nr:glycosyltransferase [Acidobacteriota bacterium]